MGLRRITVTIAVCDKCGTDWWKDTADTAPTFPTPAHARLTLLDEYGWRIDKQLDGRHRMYCPSCAVRSECELNGCDWPTATGRLAVCSRCSRIRRDDQPPTGHPDRVEDTMPGWLADLETRIFADH